jgi:hypothetical protein
MVEWMVNNARCIVGKNLSLYASLNMYLKFSGCFHKNSKQNVTESCKTHPEILDSGLKCIVKSKKKKCFWIFWI